MTAFIDKLFALKNEYLGGDWLCSLSEPDCWPQVYLILSSGCILALLISLVILPKKQ